MTIKPKDQTELSEQPDGLDEDIKSPLVTQKTGIVPYSPSDPLQRYMKELSRYALLEPDEELALAKKLHEEGDLDAAKSLVTANLRLVVKIAFEYRSVYANTMDLIQEGNIGLMKAVSKYDPTKGARLSYYASWWIRSYILKYILDNFRLVKIGTTQAQKKLFYQLVREKQRLEAQGIVAAPKLLAQRLDVREKDVVEMQQRLGSTGSEVSLDAPVDSDSDSGSRFLGFLQDPTEGADQALLHHEQLDILKDKLPAFAETLAERELKVFRERLLAEQPKTLQEVADEYGLTRERVRQIETRVLEKLRDYLRGSLELESPDPPAKPKIKPKKSTSQ